MIEHVCDEPYVNDMLFAEQKRRIGRSLLVATNTMYHHERKELVIVDRLRNSIAWWLIPPEWLYLP